MVLLFSHSQHIVLIFSQVIPEIIQSVKVFDYFYCIGASNRATLTASLYHNGFFV